MAIRSAPLSMIQVGAVLRSGIHDCEGQLLLSAGTIITQEFLIGLYRRGVHTVAVDARDWLRLNAFASHGRSRKALPSRSPGGSDWNREATRDLDAEIAAAADCTIWSSDDPFAANVQARGTEPYDADQKERVLELHQEATAQVGDCVKRLAAGETVAAEAVRQISSDFLMQAAQDMDLFVCMGINPVEGGSLFAHSTHVASLAIALGATLGLDEESLCDLGAGCLVHDAGMLHIDEGVYAARVLDASEFVEIAKHPIIGADLLYKNMERVPLGVRMVVYQMHERCDGSGYPRGTQGERIHPLAKIAAVADAYVAMVSERPHRRAMLPYYAVRQLLHDVNAGLYDQAVLRSLLYTIGMFPIGSYLELEGNEIAQVLRTNGPVYDRPVVSSWLRSRRYDAPRVVDLTLNEKRILRVVSQLA